ncbi:hypothetical protein [Asticcacaulis excentricus]|uniref:Uncharacterized protein n=1 Tax=Asticcacaulis excentricus (strain ATCC 15261 / DSM 4724 / KCTC 12464 / NCIMB 9791 / VKM B-1370 / CB 48) TaxID=573065 RepID=E8RVS0_ASTEC|nr:hypothetical protein [Asticcacaulis excentricus]ADU15342.1 hypothetical protein Astex_3725 [Asticcacaulis excentricus CB 48]
MPVIDWEKMALGTAIAASLGGVAVFVADPTQPVNARLDLIQSQLKALPKAGPVAVGAALSDVTLLAQQPIFVMSTGANAYKEKAVKLIGISISPGRRAALVSVDGQPAVWMGIGETQDELVLIEVGSNAVRFDTPVGARTISINEPAVGGAG